MRKHRLMRIYTLHTAARVCHIFALHKSMHRYIHILAQKIKDNQAAPDELMGAGQVWMGGPVAVGRL